MPWGLLAVYGTAVHAVDVATSGAITAANAGSGGLYGNTTFAP
jgi:hypothetical protein